MEGNVRRRHNSPMSIWANVLEIIETTGFFTPYILHPLQGFSTYFPTVGGTTRFDPDVSIGDLAGKVILVTGGNNGLGKETILQLAKHNPSKIYLASRSETKGREAVRSIKDSIDHSCTDIQYVSLNLTSFESVRAAARSVQLSTNRLDILICNAGIMGLPPGKTKQGHEVHFGTNHVGHHLLTKLLLPMLEKTAARPGSDVRVISISSVANDRAPPITTMLDMDKLSATGRWTRYGASKAANIWFAAELARRYPAMRSVSVHPGIIDSDIWRSTNDNNVLIRLGLMLLRPFMFETLQTGAHTQLWAAAGAKKDELQNGAYYTPVGRLDRGNPGNRRAQDVETGRALWEWTEAEIERVGS